VHVDCSCFATKKKVRKLKRKLLCLSEAEVVVEEALEVEEEEEAGEGAEVVVALENLTTWDRRSAWLVSFMLVA